MSIIQSRRVFPILLNFQIEKSRIYLDGVTAAFETNHLVRDGGAS